MNIRYREPHAIAEKYKYISFTERYEKDEYLVIGAVTMLSDKKGQRDGLRSLKPG